VKECTKCRIEKSLENFTKDSTKRDGIYPSCKACYRIYYAKVRARKLAYKDKYRQENRARISEYRVQHYVANRTKELQTVKKWAKNNPVRRRVNQAKRRARKAESAGVYTAEDINTLYHKQKGRCAVCKNRLGEDFHIDHILPVALRGDNSRLNIQLLCISCNLSKRAAHPVDFMQSRGMLL